jgi:hypothetical protein
MTDDEVTVRGEPLARPIYWKGRQWAVTPRGVEARDGTYLIHAERLWDEGEGGHSWEDQMDEKEWVDMEDFRAALSEARRRFAHLRRPPRLGRGAG